MGENHGVVINCGNDANVNTTVDQNEVDLSELTLNDLIGTENAAHFKDIADIPLLELCKCILADIVYAHIDLNTALAC